jgi:hypothetical protein
VTRAFATLAAFAVLILALAAFGFGLWATGADSVVGGFGNVAVLALSGAGVAAAWAGLVVALQGDPVQR